MAYCWGVLLNKKCVKLPGSLRRCLFESGGSVVVDLLFYVPPIVSGGSVLVFVLVCITLCPFQFCNHLDKEERAGCFAFVAFWMSCYCKCPVALAHVAVGCLQFVIVVFPDHIHLLLEPFLFIAIHASI